MWSTKKRRILFHVVVTTMLWSWRSHCKGFTVFIWWMKKNHGGSQDFFRVSKFTGVARIFSEGCTFFPQKKLTFFQSSPPSKHSQNYSNPKNVKNWAHNAQTLYNISRGQVPPLAYACGRSCVEKHQAAEDLQNSQKTWTVSLSIVYPTITT